MKKKVMIFSIGAAVLMILLSFTSMVAASAIPIELQTQIDQFKANHAGDLRTINTYLYSLTGEDNTPSNILALITTLSAEMQRIFTPYLQPQSPTYHGYTSLWQTLNGLTINPLHPNWHYWGHCLTINQFWTYVFISLILGGGAIAALVLLFLISLIPWIGLPLAKKIVNAIINHLDEIITWCQDVYQNNQYGIALYVFDPAEASSWIYNILYYCKQPSRPWASPNEMLPPGIYQQYIWQKIA